MVVTEFLSLDDDVSLNLERADAAAEQSWQQQKSAATRARLIDATIRCLVQHGYSRTAMSLVAAEAGLSRGAVLHHFANGDALIQATIIELHERRLNAFRRASKAHVRDVRAMVRDYWRQLQKPAFTAFQELAMVARTDAALAQVLQPLQIEYNDRFHALADQLYPDWVDAPEQFRLAMTLSQLLMEGMTLARLTGAMDETLIEPLLDFLEKSVVALRPGDAAPANGGRP